MVYTMTFLWNSVSVIPLAGWVHTHCLCSNPRPFLSGFTFSPPWFIRMCPVFMSQGTHRTFNKHTQCSSFFPKSQKEKAPPDKINNPPTHSLEQIHQGRDDQLCVVPWRIPAWCLLQWRALSVRAISWDWPAMGHPKCGLGLSGPAVRGAWLFPYLLTRETDILQQGSIMPKEPGITDCTPWPAGADPVPVELVSSDFCGWWLKCLLD